MNLKKVIVFLLGIAISIVSLYLIFSKIDVVASLKALSKVPFYIPLVLMGIYLFGFVIRAFRWQLMLLEVQNIPFKSLLNAIIIGYGGNNFLPVRGGELLRMEFFSRQSKVPRTISITSVLTEKILDGLSLLLLLIGIVWIFPSNLFDIDWFVKLFYLANIVFIGILFGLIIFKISGNFFINLFQKQGGAFLKISHILQDVLQALSFIKPNLRGIIILSSGILVWLVEGGMFVMASSVLVPEVNPFLLGYFTLVIVNFGILVPSSPGYVGLFQAMTVLAFTVFALSEETALTTSILVHLCQFIPISLWAIYILLKSSLKFKFFS